MINGIETILVRLVHDYVVEGTGKEKGKYCIQIAGVSDRRMATMTRLQVWDIAHDTEEEARATLKEYKARNLPSIFFVNRNKTRAD